MIIIILIIFGLYSLSMLALIIGFQRVPIFSFECNVPKTGFSIVVPFRNEAENLPLLLESISQLKYSSELFEIIFVNDSSEDISEEIILKAIGKSAFSIRLFQNKRNSHSPKKDAISEAIKHSKFEWILTTDSDCELPENWLKTLNAFIQAQLQKENNLVMICGPVLYKSDGSFLQNFQQLDGLSLQAVTVGSFGLNNPILSNGANLAYRKDAFEEVNGFSGNDHIASGDDIFLMEKMRKHFPDQVSFLKSRESIVFTKPQHSWKSVLQQRIRWASKTSKQKNPLSIFLGFLVFFVNLSFLMIPVFFIFHPELWMTFIFFLYFKIITDFIVIRLAGNFFDKRITFWQLQWMPFVYSLITILVVLGSFGGSYSWKGRKH